MSPNFKGRRILMVLQRNWGSGIGYFVASQLSSEGARLSAITYKKSTHDFIVEQNKVHFEHLINHDNVLEFPKKYLKGRTYMLKHITEQLGVDSIWPFVFASREISRSYGKGFNFANSQQLSDDQISFYLQASFAFLTDLLETFQPEAIVVSRLAEPPNLMLYHLAKKRGVRCLYITDSKVRGVWVATYSPYEDDAPVIDRIDQLNSGKKSENSERARRYIEEFREEFKRPSYADNYFKTVPFRKRIRQELAPYRRIGEWYLFGTGKRNQVGPLGATPDYQPPRVTLRDHYTKLWRRYINRTFLYEVFEKIGPYVYYPLQAEPELTLDVFAPYFSNQLELARQIAMSLPGDYTLVVKDHPAMYGIRSRSDLEQLARTPNIKLINSNVPNERVLKGASLVLAPNSTALAEAAFYNIPALQFGNQGTIQKIPNVLRHTDLTSLSRVLQSRLSVRLGGEEYERKLENFVAAAYDVGYELDYMATWEQGHAIERDKMWHMYRTELLRILNES